MYKSNPSDWLDLSSALLRHRSPPHPLLSSPLLHSSLSHPLLCSPSPFSLSPPLVTLLSSGHPQKRQIYDVYGEEGLNEVEFDVAKAPQRRKEEPEDMSYQKEPAAAKKAASVAATLCQVEPGHTILVHAAAGGVGSLLCQWPNALGATVIGAVSSKEKAAQAKEDGCHHVIIYKEEDFVARVTEITSGNGVEAVYDSVCKDTFQGSLACLKTRGYMLSFGQASGRPDPVPLSALAAKSLFLTRPALFQYTATGEKLLESAGEVFANVASGVLRVRVNHEYPLAHAGEAHEDLENRRTYGSAVLIP